MIVLDGVLDDAKVFATRPAHGALEGAVEGLQMEAREAALRAHYEPHIIAIGI